MIGQHYERAASRCASPLRLARQPQNDVAVALAGLAQRAQPIDHAGRDPPNPYFDDPANRDPGGARKTKVGARSTNLDPRFLRFFWLISGWNFGSQSVSKFARIGVLDLHGCS